MRKCRLCLSGLALTLIWSLASCGKQDGLDRSQGGNPELALSIEKVDASAGIVRVYVSARNVGTNGVVLPRLRSGSLERYGGWHGWSVQIRNDAGKDYSMLKIRAPVLQKEDLIELLPGETFGTWVNIGSACEYSMGKSMNLSSPLAKSPGNYSAVVRLGIIRDVLPLPLHSLVWIGRQESPRLDFAIPEGPQN